MALPRQRFTHSPWVSILVAARKEATTTERCLQALAAAAPGVAMGITTAGGGCLGAGRGSTGCLA
ncbi:hypothetical protein GCM10023172_16660 [Hymenobacter ginsengisoli]|uniref:Uncharacterized protein n=1 Tax=Hymenobacter ginsengisoli TaxID=1051626 RepID=A0ABP8QAP1_9BACT